MKLKKMRRKLKVGFPEKKVKFKKKIEINQLLNYIKKLNYFFNHLTYRQLAGRFNLIHFFYFYVHNTLITFNKNIQIISGIDSRAELEITWIFCSFLTLGVNLAFFTGILYIQFSPTNPDLIHILQPVTCCQST